MSNIVNISTSVQQGATPSNLQQTGAIISQGGTTLAQGTKSFLQSTASLTPLLTNAQAITALTWSVGVVTVTVSGGHGYPVSGSETEALTIAGVTYTGANPNGTVNCTITSATQFTYPLASTPGTIGLTSAVVTNYDVAELVNQVAYYFAQGGSVGVYVLELGAGDPAQGVSALSTWITANPGIIYSYLLPLYWDAEPTFITFARLYTSQNAETYFYLPVSAATWATYTGVKSVIMIASSPNAAATEVPSANVFSLPVNFQPSVVNKVPTGAYLFLYGPTQWPVNNSNISVMENANVNYAASGAEGGITNVILKKGVYADGSQLNHWYAVDWLHINSQLQLANAIINGANNRVNPLYYNQAGINTLQAVAQSVVNQGVSFGLFGGSPVVQAIPYAAYVAAFPSDYGNGIYNGLSVTISTQQGFITITFSVVVSTLAP